MRTIWKMKVTEKFYNEVIKETKDLIWEFNEDMLVNFTQDNFD